MDARFSSDRAPETVAQRHAYKPSVGERIADALWDFNIAFPLFVLANVSAIAIVLFLFE